MIHLVFFSIKMSTGFLSNSLILPTMEARVEAVQYDITSVDSAHG